MINLERDLNSAVWISEFHTSDSVLVSLKVSECMVEYCRTDSP